MQGNGYVEERKVLLDRCAEAEARQAAVSEELRALQASYARLGDTHQIVAVSTLQVLRAQFNSLAKEFNRSGDTVSDVMCEIGIRAVDQALAGEAG
jgi:predicted nuclease with TOPRIM domain